MTVEGDLRDQAGNFLDGDWSNDPLGSAFEAEFGDVVDDGIAMASCGLASDRFRPDGDPGTVALQADEAQLSVSSSTRAAFWVLEVFQGDSRVRTVRQATKGVADIIKWDGRSFDGRVVPAGAYRLQVSAMDAQGNLDAGCSLSVEVEQAYEEPERQQ